MANRKPHPARFMEYPSLEQDGPVAASSMAREFKTDSTGAEDRYHEKRLDVQGVVRYNGPDMFGLPSLELSDSADGPCDVLCVFNDEAPLRGIGEGSLVTVRGNYIGTAPQYGPTLKKCEVSARR